MDSNQGSQKAADLQSAVIAAIRYTHKLVDLPGVEPGCSIPFLPVSTSLALLIKCIPIALIHKLFGSVPAILLPLNSQSR